MVAEFGFGVLVVTFVVSLFGAGASIYGALTRKSQWIESSRLGMMLTFPLITVSILCLVYLLVFQHYEVEFVYSVTSNSMPLYLKITALWGGQAGSLLFWSWLMSAFATAATFRKWDRDGEFLPWVIVTTLVTLAFFLFLSIFLENPFARLWSTQSGSVVIAMFQPSGTNPIVPFDGNGLNPLLRHPGMIIHPPMLYLGFVAMIIPYAFAIAALVTGRTDDRWIRLTRRWTLVAWLFLSLGLVLGMRWSYDVLGWGGFWNWDPVETAALLPWLSGTAFLHSVVIQEKRSMLKRWNMILIILTYCLVILGTFLTRSGLLSSMHAFSQSTIGSFFLGFITITFFISLGLVLFRWNELKSEHQMTSVFSREALFLLNNFLFMGILVFCLWGIFFPVISELFTGQQVTVGPPYYQQTTGPFFAALLLLMGIAPLAAWRYSNVKILGRVIWKPSVVSLLAPIILFVGGIHFWIALLAFWLVAFVACVTIYEYGTAVNTRHRNNREGIVTSLFNLARHNRRRYGGYIIHLGVIMMALGIIGVSMFQTTTQGTISQGQSLSLDRYTITYQSLSVWDTADGRNIARAAVSVSQNGRVLNILYPRRDYYYDSQQVMTIPGVRQTLAGDVYVVLVDWQPISSQGATFKIFHNPLIDWLWFGAIVFILGTLIAAWPTHEIFPSNLTIISHDQPVEV